MRWPKYVRDAGVFIFYVIVVSAGVVLLAGAQLRSASGSSFDTWRLNYESNQDRVSQLTEKEKEQKKGLKEAEESQAWALQCSQVLGDDGKPKPGLDAAIDEAEKAKQTHSEDKLDGDAKCISRGLTLTQFDLNNVKSEIADLQNDVNATKKLLAAQTDQTTSLTKDHEDYLALEAMTKGTFRGPIVKISYDLLVLLLVMMMGALGGVVRILRDYGNKSVADPEPQDYFFIPLVGCVVAVGGYVIAKTGLLLLSSNQGDASLSPFTISLVGIVSGLLAKEVIDAIAARGRDMLKRAPNGIPGGQETGDESAAPRNVDSAKLSGGAAGG
jgi:hypothetical protein